MKRERILDVPLFFARIVCRAGDDLCCIVCGEGSDDVGTESAVIIIALLDER